MKASTKTKTWWSWRADWTYQLCVYKKEQDIVKAKLGKFLMEKVPLALNGDFPKCSNVFQNSSIPKR